ncbi:T9SS type A sorting domain-containing protein [Nostoc ellipsosporum NOK]|nr:T9SS type A sorting domain-containing protein [Nostoc ellipsosporum NOK]
MKRTLLYVVAIMVAATRLHAQCTFLSPTVELNSVTSNVNGNCVVNFDLGFEIDINNGNKIIFVHLWKSGDYVDFNYGTQNQPKESNVLANALATIIIDNDLLNNNPSAPASQVFLSSYGPDPGIDDNTGPAQQQVKDASDGLTYNRVVVNAANNTYRYTISNITVVVPGGCSGILSFTGDAWSSNSNATNSSVQCTMEGITFQANDPTITGFRPCSNPRTYNIGISTQSVTPINVTYDVYLDNGDNVFDISSDILLADDQGGVHAISASAPYSISNQSYPPYSNSATYDTRIIWVLVSVQGRSNLTLKGLPDGNCIPLPVKLKSFVAQRSGGAVQLNWVTAGERNNKGFEVERLAIDGTAWVKAGFVTSGSPGGNSDVDLSYSFTDPNYSKGVTQYRLKQINIDEQVQYSDVRMVNGLEQKEAMIVYPNPSTDGTINILFRDQQSMMQLSVIDISGRQVYSRPPFSGKYVSISGLKRGYYLLTATDNTKQMIWTQKFQIR